MLKEKSILQVSKEIKANVRSKQFFILSCSAYVDFTVGLVIIGVCLYKKTEFFLEPFYHR